MLNVIAPIYTIEDIEKVKAAKATSIVVGSAFFSVRSISHFSIEEIAQIQNHCKQYEMSCYVLCNRFFVESELPQLETFLQQLKVIDVDGIYFSDMGVFEKARQLQMQDKMIYNPDTILTNALDVQAYLDLGMKMCTLSKEITLEDMVSIGKKVQGEVEVIVHGRLHMMHSKRNLLSNYMEFIKKDKSLKNNKNLYLCEENRGEHMPIIEDEHGTHMYTGFTLCSFEELEDIYKANIQHLRIEGMFYEIEEICQLIKDYIYVHENPLEGRKKYQEYVALYPDQNITKGFLYKKTGLVK